MKLVAKYQAFDGSLFDLVEDCVQHELTNAIHITGENLKTYTKSQEGIKTNFVYVMIRSDECLYVGRTGEITQRFAMHYNTVLRDLQLNDLVIFIPCSSKEAASLTEQTITKILRPIRQGKSRCAPM
jgi:predicted GIY-YIG superfamily endonuclease